ncbi:hypothetical protein EDD15DRAFT_2166842 [Pisolithus albus]|nr:hypothetical protein EDD15DRAFT_2166842 [Pisolithus albus]
MFSVCLYEVYSSFRPLFFPRIMGSMGSGRSNFIDKLTEPEGANAPHGIGSPTQDISEYAVMLGDHCEYVFVDTPGFNDSVRPAIQVLHTIADWLVRKYREGALLTGVIFTYEVTDFQMYDSLSESLDLFCCICGDKAARRVRLVTTMWEQVKDPLLAEITVSRLETNLWKPLLDAGARHMRFVNSKRSAWSIIKDLGVEREPLLLQQELVDAEKHLYETFAGRALYLQLQHLSQKELQPNMRFRQGAWRRQVGRPVNQLGADCEHIEKQLRKVQKERQRLKMRRHPYWHRLFFFLFNPNIATPEFTENCLVIL